MSLARAFFHIIYILRRFRLFRSNIVTNNYVFKFIFTVGIVIVSNGIEICILRFLET